MFTVECHTAPGECVVLVGSSREFGEWNPATGVKMMTSDEDFPRWTSPPIKLAVPSCNEPVFYKYLIAKHGQDSEEPCTWEAGPNRMIVPSSVPRNTKEPSHVEDLAFAQGYNPTTDVYTKTIKRKSSRVRSASRDRLRESETESTLRATVRALQMQNEALLKESGIRESSYRRFTCANMFLVALLLLIALAFYFSGSLPLDLQNMSSDPKSWPKAFPAIALVLIAIMIRGMSRGLFARRLRARKTAFHVLPLV